MNKFLAILAALLISNAVIAGTNSIEITKEQINTLDNRVDWVLKKATDQYGVQNTSGKALRLDLFVDKFISGTSIASDGVYVLCGNNLVIIPAGSGAICDLPYPGSATVLSYPYVNGATGRLSVF